MMTRVDRDQYGHVDDAGPLPGQAPSRPAHPELRPAPGWLPDEVRIYATGDIHGRADLLGLMLAAIDRDLELAARNLGASAWRTFLTVTLPLATPGLMASAVFVFLESLDEFTGTFFVGVPQVTTLPLLLYNAAMGGNYQVASITALILLVPSVLFMLFIERFLRADVLAKVGA